MSTRDEYIEKVKAQLDEWNSTIDKLEAKTQKEKAEVKLKYENRIKELKEKRSALQEKLKSVSEATDDAWETLKHESGKLLDDMMGTFDEKPRKLFYKDSMRKVRRWLCCSQSRFKGGCAESRDQ